MQDTDTRGTGLGSGAPHLRCSGFIRCRAPHHPLRRRLQGLDKFPQQGPLVPVLAGG